LYVVVVEMVSDGNQPPTSVPVLERHWARYRVATLCCDADLEMFGVVPNVPLLLLSPYRTIFGADLLDSLEVVNELVERLEQELV
jgi:hypothetical protein